MDAQEEAMARQLAMSQASQESSQLQQLQKEKEKETEMEEQRRIILQQVMDTDAAERMTRIGLVKPEKKRSMENFIIMSVQKGQIREKITEPMLIKMLEGMEDGAQKSSVTIQRKRADDSDDDINLDY